MTDKFTSIKVPGPAPTAVSMPFWQAAKQGELRLQHCGACQQWVFYPRVICPHCWSEDLSWKQASGRAHLRSFTVVHRPGHPAWTPAAPYVLAIVQLAEGPTMLTQVISPTAEHLSIGMGLQVSFQPIGDYVLPFFESESTGRTV